MARMLPRPVARTKSLKEARKKAKKYLEKGHRTITKAKKEYRVYDR